MKWLFFFIVLLHAVIHTFGFLKAFRFAEFNQLTQQIAKSAGVLWLVCFLFLLLSAILFVSNNDYWWMAASAGVILSQILIIMFWHDAKFGTLPNILILLVAVVGFSEWDFNCEVKNEIIEMFARNKIEKTEVLTKDKISHLPSTVQQWLRNSGVIGKEIIQTVRLKQMGSMKLKPEQKDWYIAYAEQFFTISKPAFVWKTKVDMIPLVYFNGRDFFADGKGKMLIKILSLFNIVNAHDEKINQGTMQRFLAEIVWFPTAAVNSYINWENLDSSSAKATLNYKGSEVTGIFYFNDEGDFEKFSTMRYMGSGDKAVLKEWIITVKENEIINGIKIPTKLEISWKLDSGIFTWFVLKVCAIEYNKPELWN